MGRTFTNWGDASTGQGHNPPDCHAGTGKGYGVFVNYPDANNKWEDGSWDERRAFVCSYSVTGERLSCFPI